MTEVLEIGRTCHNAHRDSHVESLESSGDMIGILRPAEPAEPLPCEAARLTYRRLRLQVFGGIFIGYAGYYLLRKNFSLAMPFLIEEGYSRTELGLALSGVSIAYGLSKLLMGSVSDRSNARFFMALGLASVVIFALVWWKESHPE